MKNMFSCLYSATKFCDNKLQLISLYCLCDFISGDLNIVITTFLVDFFSADSAELRALGNKAARSVSILLVSS